MQIEILGSGGALTTPKPGCTCAICQQARERGTPYARTGPSVFVHGPDILIDTPEEAKAQIDRSRIVNIAGCFYSHWHPDHTMGRRVWESRNFDFRNWPRHVQTTDIYLPQQVAIDFRYRLGLWEHFQFLEHLGVVRINELTDDQTVTLNGVHIQPFRVAEDYVYAFLVEDERNRVLIAPDELFGWTPPELGKLDLAVLPMGIVEFNPFTGAREIDAEHSVLKTEATFNDTKELIRNLNVERVILTHIEEMSQLSYDDLLRLAALLNSDGLPVEFAWDTMHLDI